MPRWSSGSSATFRSSTIVGTSSAWCRIATSRARCTVASRATSPQHYGSWRTPTRRVRVPKAIPGPPLTSHHLRPSGRKPAAQPGELEVGTPATVDRQPLTGPPETTAGDRIAHKEIRAANGIDSDRRGSIPPLGVARKLHRGRARRRKATDRFGRYRRCVVASVFFGREFIPSVLVPVVASGRGGDPEDPIRLVGRRVQRTNL
jgi:hypothetical protein